MKEILNINKMSKRAKYYKIIFFVCGYLIVLSALFLQFKYIIVVDIYLLLIALFSFINKRYYDTKYYIFKYIKDNDTKM